MLNRACRLFLDAYQREYPMVQQAATLAATIVRSCLHDYEHLISFRAKAPESLRAKLRRKRYEHPVDEVTDIIGVRVITYYQSDIDAVVARLRSEFDINIAASADRRGALGPRTFGYQSVHLIARLKSPRDEFSEYRLLAGRWFEIQVRSILEHAWAEIEHEVVYKAGTKYPDSIVRRFAAIAGALEILDKEFLSLRSVRNELIEQYRIAYSRRALWTDTFDAARLLGFLEAFRPHGLSWRQAAQRGTPFAPRIETSCIEALQAVKLSTANRLVTVMRTPRFRSMVRSLAALEGIAPQAVSHLALVVLAVGAQKPRVLEQHFPEMIYNPSVETILKRLRR